MTLQPICILLVAASLFGCTKATDASYSGAGHHGRYVGVGLYPADDLWTQLTLPVDASKDPAAARLGDDQQIIVVVDSDTGELRQCGNMSGYCVRMNPWAKPLPAAQSAPAAVAKHADQLAKEAEAASETPAR